ncbi:TIGR02300 family protein [Paenochrobactrum glaciei]|uniref:TIGR02300 family protein n=1 Tax=Paenochrobactrum glaciei TaxID=486407 RepID=A0ABN1FRW5_9HYPH
MAKPELGTKRIDPETGRKFYDLNRDPIVSPYTGQSYPRSYFETSVDPREEEEEAEGVDVAADAPEFISLEDADGDVKDDDIPDLDDDVELDDDGDDTFLEEEDDEDDMTGLIGGGVSDEDDEG